MDVSSPGHGIHRTADELMLDGRLEFIGQILFHADLRVTRGCGCHGKEDTNEFPIGNSHPLSWRPSLHQDHHRRSANLGSHRFDIKVSCGGTGSARLSIRTEDALRDSAFDCVADIVGPASAAENGDDHTDNATGFHIHQGAA